MILDDEVNVEDKIKELELDNEKLLSRDDEIFLFTEINNFLSKFKNAIINNNDDGEKIIDFSSVLTSIDTKKTQKAILNLLKCYYQSGFFKESMSAKVINYYLSYYLELIKKDKLPTSDEVDEYFRERDKYNLFKRKRIVIEKPYDLINGYILYLREREILIRKNLKLAIHVARTRSVDYKYLDDNINIAICGLVKAIDTYKVGKGIKFSSYATRVINNYMTRYNDRYGRLVRVPVGEEENLRKLKKYYNEFYICNGVYPSIDDIKNKYNWSYKIINLLRQFIEYPECLSLDKVLPDSDGVKLKDVVSDDRDEYANLVEKTDKIDINDLLISTLREEEIEVVKLFYGFDQDAKSYKEIEQILNIKPRRINHLLEKSKKKLRKKLLIDSVGRPKNNK